MIESKRGASAMSRFLTFFSRMYSAARAHPWYWIDWFIIAIAAAAAAFMEYHAQPPSVAIGVLATVAVVMTFSHPDSWQRAIVIIISGALLFLELESLRSDRLAQQTSAASALSTILSNNRTATAAILDDNQRRFDANEGQFLSIIRDMKRLNNSAVSSLGATRRNLELLTGGDSYPYIEPMKDPPHHNITVIIRSIGSVPLSGVTISLIRRDKGGGAVINNIGTITPTSFLPREEVRIVPDIHGTEVETWEAIMNTPHGLYKEILQFREAVKPGNWLMRFRVSKLNMRRTGEDFSFNEKPLFHTDWWDGNDEVKKVRDAPSRR